MSLERSEAKTLVRSRGRQKALRQRLRDAEVVLAEAAARIESARREVRPMLADMLEQLRGDIQRQAQISLVRGATVCLHNLIVSLRSRGPIDPATLVDEIRAAGDALRELLQDPIFGLSEREILEAARRGLAARGIERPLCGHEQFNLELLTYRARPFPDDPLFSPVHTPVAAVTCNECGHLSMHRLDVLGVLPPGFAS